ncbi:SpoIIE family protein phosphatase [Streptomyces sp. PR69]|uniref:SpoIIE family protein phosphatase n=1 Tax=Streptomyces sp. PR69 TaxID=2984950 RepID=UPI00226471FA|nr:SpoIIE family protein phosphatase [Streptomyces sp. PR69]
MSEIPETASGVVWQSSPPGSIYDYIRVASFSIGPDGLVDQWSRRAADLFGLDAGQVRGKDPVDVFMPADLRPRGYRRIAEILDGKEWTGLVPYRVPGDGGSHGVAEVYVMPSETETGERGALCIVVDVRALRRIETDLASSQAIFGQSPFGFLLFDTDLTVLRANQRFAAVFGGAAEDHRGRTVHDYLSRPEAERMDAALRRVLETGESVTDIQIIGTPPGSTERRHWAVNLYRVHSGSGRPVGVAGLGSDVTRRNIAAREAASARRNLALLNEASARIGNSLDLETTARELLDVAVPGFCDLASVDLYQALLTGDEASAARWDSARADGGSGGASTPGGGGSGRNSRGGGDSSGGGVGELRRVAFASAVSDAPLATTLGCGVPGSAPTAVGEVHRYPADSPCAGALRTARVQSVPGEDGSLVHTTLAVPMVAHDTVVGLVQFSRTKGSEPFGERDRALAVELAARAAVCIDNARLYRREHERALILQRSLLPPGDPEAAGLDIACRYLPGNTATEVGGDWFDVIQLPGHRTALVVGDVMGRGLRAAVAMGELRTAVRTLALLDLEPAEVLSALDEIARGLGTPGGHPGPGGVQAARVARKTHRAAHRDRNGEDGEGGRGGAGGEGDQGDGGGQGGEGGHGGQSGRGGQGVKTREADLSEVYLATCVYAVYDPVTRRCTFANAGHLPPVLVEPGEAALLLDVPPGMPLGVGGEPFEEVEVELPEGALLALYTDGLVESRDHSLDEGLRAFRAVLTDPVRPLEDVCDHVLSTLDTRHGEDDIALLMARIQGLPTEAVGDWRLPREPRSVGRARELARAQLIAWDLEALVDTVELLVSELVTNALRYGEGEIRLRLLRDRTLVCEVWDAGLVQPRRRRARDTDEGGRGLQLVGLLSAGWGSRRTPRGKTVWFELGLPDGEGAVAEPTAEQLLSLY